MNDTLSVDDVINNLTETLSECSGETIADCYNRVCTTQVRYVEDDIFVQSSDDGEQDLDGDQTLKMLADTLAEAEGEFIAEVYNDFCSDRIVYLGDSLYERSQTEEEENDGEDQG